jgi:Ran GTPase-activating protein (RanGAP) involved in mRNA processing and transport
MLVELSLASNSITDVGAEKLASFLDYAGNQLRSLNLHWNRIKFKGGLRLAEVLITNEVLKILDLSWNLLGQWSQAHLGRLPMSELMKKLKGEPQASAGDAFAKLSQ